MLEHYFQQMALNLNRLNRLRRILRLGGAKITPKGIALPRLGTTKVLREQRDEYYDLCREYDALMEEVLSLGVEVVNPELGVVNFYSWWDGEEVIFNWQFGEPTVQFWFDPGEPYSARRPIRQLVFDAPVAQTQRH